MGIDGGLDKGVEDAVQAEEDDDETCHGGRAIEDIEGDLSEAKDGYHQ